MKWLALVVVGAGILPFALWLRGNRRLLPPLLVALGFLPFVLGFPGLDIALVSWPEWLGFAHGIEVTLIDVLALSLYLGQRKARDVPFKAVISLYFAAIALSLTQAELPLAASFYLWQFARVILIYLVVLQACDDDRAPGALLMGMGLGLALQLAVVVWQRYGLGIIQTPGTFAHQNTLGMALHFVVLPHVALLLAGRRDWQTIAVPLIGALIAVFTTSRAALGLTATGLILVYLLSSVRQWTAWKGSIGAAGLVVAAVLAPIVVSSFAQRFEAVPLPEAYDERAAFNRAAESILEDNPLGVGANHYVVTAKFQGYSEQAGVIPFESSRNAHVHNAYWLAAAETGYLGAFAFILLILQPTVAAFRYGWSTRADYQDDLLIGIGIAFIVVISHNFVEWIFFSAQIQYLFAIEIGLIAGIIQRMKTEYDADVASK